MDKKASVQYGQDKKSNYNNAKKEEKPKKKKTILNVHKKKN